MIETEIITSSSPSTTLSLSHFTSSLLKLSCDRDTSQTMPRTFSTPDGGIEKCIIDPRSHLEVLDSKHRYAKNLKAYYNQWCATKNPMNFFDWLDSPECEEISKYPKSLLNSEVVYYCLTESDRDRYRVEVTSVEDKNLLCNSSTKTPITTGDQGLIFVTRNGQIYMNEKITKTFPRFHHSSFFAGDYVDAAGMMHVENGILKTLFLHSGHYRPSETHLYKFLHLIVDELQLPMDEAVIDAQRLLKLPRGTTSDGGKARKIDTPLFCPLLDIYYFLRTKKSAWLGGVFNELYEEVQRRNTEIDDNLPITELSSLPPVSPVRRFTSADIVPQTFANICRSHVVTCKYELTTTSSMEGISYSSGCIEGLDPITGSREYPLTARRRDEGI